ncbi:hypothetical protein [Hydrotalea sandarakina]|jgi:hypothetical protein|uniref:Uncharacterized protein n=1 Tax=Hydrotalea sandarakina TaxID=1004304 RepID=A0A2W7RNG3_9BACT|nr:hypothetical protein [Hydrotalea sandarakina]PZX62323.1 hypothetical protein LX80_01805 [Hydrotalea sandarakina]
MKRIIYLLLVASLLLNSTACKKTGADVNPLSDITTMSIGTYLVLDSVVNLNLNSTSITTSTASIIVSQYKGGQPIDHIDLFVATTPTYDTTKWKKVKTIPYAGKGTTISVNGQELANALGIAPTSIAPGTSYYFYNRSVTKSGSFWDVSNTGYANDATNLIAGSNYNSAFSFTVNIVCPFVAPMGGTYMVVEDDWQDWNPGDLVTVTDGPGTNQLNISQVYPNPAYGTSVQPLYINVDPATGVATIPAGINFANYSGVIASTLSGGGGNVFSCTGVISVKVHINYGSYGDQGFFKLILQKQ